MNIDKVQTNVRVGYHKLIIIQKVEQLLFY